MPTPEHGRKSGTQGHAATLCRTRQLRLHPKLVVEPKKHRGSAGEWPVPTITGCRPTPATRDGQRSRTRTDARSRPTSQKVGTAAEYSNTPDSRCVRAGPVHFSRRVDEAQTAAGQRPCPSPPPPARPASVHAPDQGCARATTLLRVSSLRCGPLAAKIQATATVLG